MRRASNRGYQAASVRCVPGGNDILTPEAEFWRYGLTRAALSTIVPLTSGSTITLGWLLRLQAVSDKRRSWVRV